MYRVYDWKVRLHSLLCLKSLAKVSGVSFQQYWPQFIPASRNISRGNTRYRKHRTLYGILLTDENPRVRVAALQLLTTMLEGSKKFLTMADSTKAMIRYWVHLGIFDVLQIIYPVIPNDWIYGR